MGPLKLVLMLVRETIESVGFGGFFVVLPWTKVPYSKVFFFVFNLCLSCGIPSFGQVDARIHIKVKLLEHWVRITAIFAPCIHLGVSGYLSQHLPF